MVFFNTGNAPGISQLKVCTTPAKPAELWIRIALFGKTLRMMASTVGYANSATP
jgi:hypothetical protein